MEKKLISLSGLKNVLSPKEMKNITGGSGIRCCCGMGANSSCADTNTDDCDKAMQLVIDACSMFYGGFGGCFC